MRPTLNEAEKLVENNTIIPICEEIFSDVSTPVLVLNALKKLGMNTFLYESAEGGKQWGRYSFLGYNPQKSITCNNAEIIEMDLKSKGKKRIKSSNPQIYLRNLLSKYKSPKLDYMPDFTGGLVGYISYDFLKYSHVKVELKNKVNPDFNDFELMLYDKVIVFDHVKAKIFIIINIEIENLKSNYQSAVEEISYIKQLIIKQNGPHKFTSNLKSEFYSQFTKEEYCKKVETIKTHIYEGDIFQAVLSNRLFADFEGDLLPAYRYLRTSNPSPYMFYIYTNEMQIAGASPETLVKQKNNILTTHPIAGTCPRVENETEQKRLIKELLNDQKELAEHNMLVDLGRNDLGKVCEFGTVSVFEYMKIKKFSHVVHICSTVTGKLSSKFDCFDTICSILPAGTLSGAPKERACEIINENEMTKRGIYGGAIGYFDFFGDMDFCIAIRMAVKKENKVYVQAGAGIVADSDPQKEYHECLHKAKAVISALKSAQEE